MKRMAITFKVFSPILVLSAFFLHRRKNIQVNVHDENKSKKSYDVFISYSIRDKNVADALCSTLESRKIRCWIAPRDMRIGIDLPLAIIQGLDSCRILVLVFSSNSNKSNQTILEVERAVNRGMPIVPLRIEGIEPTGHMEYLLSTPHWLDSKNLSLEQQLQKIADTVQLRLTNKEEYSDSNSP
jgi:TIR domain